ncbi:MAG: hypothetical protein FWB83_03780 [Treponema sp.]|nr:hypothetical protein [Treponema sp.]
MKLFLINIKNLNNLILLCVTLPLVLFANSCDLPVEEKMPVDAPLREKFQWLQKNAASSTEYFIELKNNETLSPQVLAYHGRNNITIQLAGIGSERIILLSGYGSLFTIVGSVNLILDNNVTLQGHDNNNAPLVSIGNMSTLTMNSGAKITGNTANSNNGYGGGVFINSNGTFLMTGGIISYNRIISESPEGGGVFVGPYGIFTMTGGVITGNEVRGTSDCGGGGIFIYSNGIFTMTGGEISSNKSSSNNQYIYGGGVCAFGSLTKTGGIIYGYTEGDNNSNIIMRNDNTVLNGRGHAVYHWNYTRDTTAYSTDNMTLQQPPWA